VVDILPDYYRRSAPWALPVTGRVKSKPEGKTLHAGVNDYNKVIGLQMDVA
jgi:hypothetical protein